MAGHIPRRDTASNAKELDSANKENRKLKREIAKLQKYVAKLLAQQSATETDPEPTEQPIAAPADQCPTCASGVTAINLGSKTLRACKNCGWRKAM